jgi:hypothetical protein
MKALSTKALAPNGFSRKALVTRLHPAGIARTLRYPSYQRLALQRALVPAAGSIVTGVGNLVALGAGALHGSAGFIGMTVHLVAVVVVAPLAGEKAGV